MIAALFAALAAPLPPPPPADPLTVTVHSVDADRFAAMMARTGDRPTARDIQRDYLDGASYGVQVFTPGRIGDAERMAKAIARDPQGYRRAIDLCLPRAKASEARLRAIYLGLHGLFPDQALPHIYLVFGAGNSGGTAGPGAQVIGIETLCKVSADGAAFDAFLRHFYAHETVHTLQREEATDGAKAPLLAQILTEGGADFVARLVTGDEPDPKRAEWAAAHTDMLMRQLRDDLAATRGADLEKLTETSPQYAAFHRWIGNYGDAPEGWPYEMGYWVGMQVWQGYFDRAADKHAAVRRVLAIGDPDEVLAKSGVYSTR